jgi:SAM-dependent methyltransferase
MPFSSNQVSFRTHARTWLRFFLGWRLGPYHEVPAAPALLQLAKLKQHDHLFDIGAGDGKLLIEAARTYGCKATGIELDKKVAELCRKNVAASGLQQLITVREQNALKADLSDATCVSLYLSERGNASLLPLLNPWLLSAPERRVVSFLFPMPSWQPVQVELEANSQIPMFLFDRSSVPKSIAAKFEQARKKREEAEKK